MIYIEQQNRYANESSIAYVDVVENSRAISIKFIDGNETIIYTGSRTKSDQAALQLLSVPNPPSLCKILNRNGEVIVNY